MLSITLIMQYLVKSQLYVLIIHNIYSHLSSAVA